LEGDPFGTAMIYGPCVNDRQETLCEVNDLEQIMKEMCSCSQLQTGIEHEFYIQFFWKKNFSTK